MVFVSDRTVTAEGTRPKNISRATEILRPKTPPLTQKKGDRDLQTAHADSRNSIADFEADSGVFVYKDT